MKVNKELKSWRLKWLQIKYFEFLPIRWCRYVCLLQFGRTDIFCWVLIFCIFGAMTSTRIFMKIFWISSKRSYREKIKLTNKFKFYVSNYHSWIQILSFKDYFAFWNNFLWKSSSLGSIEKVWNEILRFRKTSCSKISQWKFIYIFDLRRFQNILLCFRSETVV